MVVLGLQLDSVLVVPSDLCVTGEEKPLVVHDPVEHLHIEEGEKMQYITSSFSVISRNRGTSSVSMGVCPCIQCTLLFIYVAVCSFYVPSLFIFGVWV